MKKKMLLFGIILLSSFGLMGNVEAETYVDYGSLEIRKAHEGIYISSLHEYANLYHMFLNDESANKKRLAFCIDHGLKASGGYKYQEKGLAAYSYYRATYGFADMNSNREDVVFAMQTILWKCQKDGSASFITDTSDNILLYNGTTFVRSTPLEDHLYWLYLDIHENASKLAAFNFAKGYGRQFKNYYLSGAYSSLTIYQYSTGLTGAQRIITALKLDGVRNSDDKKYYCIKVTDGSQKDITIPVQNCINTGKTPEVCEREVRESDPECKNEMPYFCTSPTTGAQIEITTCVNNLVNTGVSIDSAVSQCTAQTPACQPRCKIDASLNHAVCDSSDTKNLNYSTKGNCLDNYTGEVVDGKRINKAGILAGDMGGYCRIYCSENLTEVFPGSINKAVNPGAYVIWPSIESNMSIASTRTCKVYVKEDAQTQYDAKQDDYNRYYSNTNCTYCKAAMDYYISNANCNGPQSDYNRAYQAFKTAESRKSQGDSQCNHCHSGTCPAECEEGEEGPCSKPCCKTKKNCEDNNPASCGQLQREYDAAKEEMNKRKAALDSCNTLNSKYNAMQAVVNTLNACLNDNLSSYKKFSPKGTITYTDECNNSSDTNYSGTFNLTANTSQYCNGRCSSLTAVNSPSRQIASARANKDAFANGISRIEGNAEMTVTSNTTFSLSHSDGNYYYQYISKDTTYPEYKNQKNGLTNYVDLKKSVLPVCNSSSIGTHSGALSASITDIGYKWNSSNQTVSGSQYTFGNNNSYVCSYKVNNVNECICPSGTVHEFEPVPCPVDPSDSDSCATQKEKLCDEWNWDEEGDFCNATDCTLTSNSLKVCVIYRTISLENPFPGKSGNNSVSGISLTNSLSRKPGSNWNDKNLIKAQITNARESSGNDIYKKEPLYRFVLTGDILKEIRKYNDTRESHGGYADYTLTCKNGLNGTSRTSACISNFVHTPRISGLTDGTCSSLSISSSAQNFYKCSGDV